MNKEERQSFEKIKSLYNNGFNLIKATQLLENDTRCLEILLNLIEKQEKIIEQNNKQDLNKNWKLDYNNNLYFIDIK